MRATWIARRQRFAWLSLLWRSKLSIYLPHKVDEDKGKAKWDGGKKVLLVTLPIVREDPF